MITALDAARIIDISAVRTHHGRKDIEELVGYAKKYRFINIHVLSCWISTLVPLLADVEGVFVGGQVGFPSGAHTTETKICETRQLIEDGVQEMDIVMNVGKFKSGEREYALDELSSIVALAGARVKTKVIIEINVLSDDEMIDACELVKKSGADYVKSGTGWIPGGANIERIKKMKEYCGPDIKVKAAGGIRSLEDFMSLYEIGVDRMGINTISAIEIIETLAGMEA
ncbi:MAG: deoxyribose-phosphate aldolase [Synergistaceae bacterium]|jgi:deoxyribose-phosphate aldolase|nr:deoxyribose-phosphate aldolase [Synergistaceae bacterium]